MMRKSYIMFMIAGIARVLSTRKSFQIRTGEDHRLYGRLLHWAKTHLGVTTTQSERDRVHGEPAAHPDVNENEMSEEEDIQEP
jgi:hypothetical protein